MVFELKVPEKPASKEVQGEKPKAPVLTDNPETPDSNVKAKAVATGKTAEAKKKGAELAEKAKKPKELKIPMFGQEVVMKIEKGIAQFLDSKTGQAISNIGKWILDKAIETTSIAKIEKDTKQYTDKVGATTPEQKAKATKELNGMSIIKLQNGADENGKIQGTDIERAALRSQAVLDKKNNLTYKVSDNLENIKNNAYLDYQHVLPPNVTTIVVERSGKKVICIRKSDVSKGGKTSYIDIVSGKQISMLKGDTFRIIGTQSTEAKEYKEQQSKEKKYNEVRISHGYSWSKDKEKPVKVVKSKPSADYSSYVEPSAYSPSVTPSSSSSQSHETSSQVDSSKSEVKLEKGKENLKIVRNPEINGGRPVYLCTFPKQLDPGKKARCILYLHGFGDAKTKGADMMRNAQTMGGLDKLSKDNNENIIFIIPTGESSKSFFPEISSNRSKLENFMSFCTREAFEGKNTPQTKIDYYLMGHSGANYGMEKILNVVQRNYFKGLGLFDTLYSKNTGKKYADLLKKNHPGTDVFSVYRSIGKPGENNPQLEADLASKTQGPKGHFERAKTNDHSAIKYPGVPDALGYFTSNA